MADQQHPITPPPELVQQWIAESASEHNPTVAYSLVGLLATAAAQWGWNQRGAATAAQWGWNQRGAATKAELQKAADQELEACCKWLGVQETRNPKWFDLRHDACALVSDLRAARRPKPPSLKERALRELGDIYNDEKIDDHVYDAIRTALEALPND